MGIKRTETPYFHIFDFFLDFSSKGERWSRTILYLPPFNNTIDVYPKRGVKREEKDANFYATSLSAP